MMAVNAAERLCALLVEPALPTGDYLVADASLKIKVHLSYPLTSVAELTDHITSQPSMQVCDLLMFRYFSLSDAICKRCTVCVCCSQLSFLFKVNTKNLFLKSRTVAK